MLTHSPLRGSAARVITQREKNWADHAACVSQISATGILPDPAQGWRCDPAAFGDSGFNCLKFVKVAGQSRLTEIQAAPTSLALKLAQALFSLLPVEPREQHSKKVSNGKIGAFEFEGHSFQVTQPIVCSHARKARAYVRFRRFRYWRSQLIPVKLVSRRLFNHYHGLIRSFNLGLGAGRCSLAKHTALPSKLSPDEIAAERGE